MMGKEAVFLKTFDPTDYADPLFGVGSATSAGPTLPSGSIHPSPETLEKDCGGYLREQPIIGFGHAYTSGAGGTKCYGNFLLSPTVDRAELDHSRRAVFATTENYYLHGTRVEEIIFHLGNGRELRITGENVGEKKIYVQSATWQGKALDTCKLTHEQLTAGGELHFVMGEHPSDWAKK
jgi:putative alpha-1,2-mannosidase